MRYKKSKTVEKHMGTDLKMQPDVYVLRTEVMSIVYKAKFMLRAKGYELPRINVRITDNRACTSTLGYGGNNQIWISKSALTTHKRSLYEIVLHEIVHAVTGFLHDDKCPLMSPSINLKPLTEETANIHFLKYFDRESNRN